MQTQRSESQTAAYEQYLAERGAGETLGEWFERTSEALWGAQNEHDPDDDWDALADDLRKSAVRRILAIAN